jgi:hypothetical protein
VHQPASGYRAKRRDHPSARIADITIGIFS